MDVFLLAFLCRCTFLSKSFIINMAEGVGFEPTDPCGSPVFKTGALNRSAIPPLTAHYVIEEAGVNGKRCALFSRQRKLAEGIKGGRFI